MSSLEPLTSFLSSLAISPDRAQSAHWNAIRLKSERLGCKNMEFLFILVADTRRGQPETETNITLKSIIKVKNMTLDETKKTKMEDKQEVKCKGKDNTALFCTSMVL